MKNVWSMQEARNRLGQMMEAALRRGSQTITKNGKPMVMMVAAGGFRQLQRCRKTVEVLQACPEKDFLTTRH